MTKLNRLRVGSASLVLLLALGAFLSVGCEGVGESARTESHPHRAPEGVGDHAPLRLGAHVGLMRSPRVVTESCAKAALVSGGRTLCPMLLPRAVLGFPEGFPPGPVYTRNLDLERTGSPDFHTGPAHLPGWRGGPCCSLHFGVYLSRAQRPPPSAAEAVLGGRPGWILPATGDGPFWGNHMRFFFRDGRQMYVAGLHSFGPATRSLLEQLVESLASPGDRGERRRGEAATGYLAGAPTDLQYAFDSLWVATTAGGLEATGAIVRMSPQSLDVRNRVRIGGAPVGLVVAENSLLVAHQQRSADGTRLGGAVSAISPKHLRITRSRVVFPRGRSRALTYAPGRAWIIDGIGGELAEFDPLTLRIRWRLGGIGNALAGVAFARGRLWVTDFASGTVIQVDPERRRIVSRTTVGGAPSAIVSAGPALWIADTDGAALARLDSSSGRVTGRVSVGLAPYSLAQNDHTVFVASLGDGRVTAVDKRTGLSAGHYEVDGDVLGLSVTDDSRIFVGVSSDRLIRRLITTGGEVHPAKAKGERSAAARSVS